MLDKLFELIDKSYGRDTFFMGLAFKFDKGIAMIDKHFAENIDDGYVVEWVSFVDIEKPVSVICEDISELYTLLRELAL
ncbi:hypothetical protein A8L34_16085 [Bacillus sp. FJAT-27264]|nr:hypothetical protein A8L34_16085 [Bacillus sp. FJAT-27264]